MISAFVHWAPLVLRSTIDGTALYRGHEAQRRCTLTSWSRTSACVPHNQLRVPIVAVPMTTGGDVLFPGGSQMLSIPLSDALRASEAPDSEFGYLPIDAWDEPSSVGTYAVVDEFQSRSTDGTALMLCSGLRRFRVISLDNDRAAGTVEIFHDDPVEEDQLPQVLELENELVAAMKEIVRLSIKISDESDERRQKALSETLKRMEAFCGQEEDTASSTVINNWFTELESDIRREILSFIVLDLLSLSFMSRRSLMLGTDTAMRLSDALSALEPFLKELAAKGAIISALGKGGPDHPENKP